MPLQLQALPVHFPAAPVVEEGLGSPIAGDVLGLGDGRVKSGLGEGR